MTPVSTPGTSTPSTNQARKYGCGLSLPTHPNIGVATISQRHAYATPGRAGLAGPLRLGRLHEPQATPFGWVWERTDAAFSALNRSPDTVRNISGFFCRIPRHKDAKCLNRLALDAESSIKSIGSGHCRWDRIGRSWCIRHRAVGCSSASGDWWSSSSMTVGSAAPSSTIVTAAPAMDGR